MNGFVFAIALLKKNTLILRVEKEKIINLEFGWLG